MERIFYLLAPLVFVAIIVLSGLLVWAHFINRRNTRGSDMGPIAAFLAGWVACAFVTILVRIGSLTLPDFPVNNTVIFLAGFIGVIVGVAYLYLARVVLGNIGNTVITSLFVLGSVSGSLISLLFYYTYEQVQVALISAGVGFLFGVLLYVALFESRGGQGGLQETWRNLRRGRR